MISLSSGTSLGPALAVLAPANLRPSSLFPLARGEGQSEEVSPGTSGPRDGPGQSHQQRERTPAAAGGRRLFLANVGANAAHRAWSPLLADGSFELLPIPERRPLPSPPTLTYGDLRAWRDGGGDLNPFYPASWAARAVHLDPDFASLTYGDDCSRPGRGAGLRSLRPGDLLFFLARLVSCDEGRASQGRASPAPTGAAGFYLVGFLDVEEIVPELRGPLAPGLMARFGPNAHVRRALADPAYYDAFWLFGGSPRSRRLSRAVPLDRALAEACLADRDRRPWRWGGGRSELQVIGSYTRSCRCILDPARVDDQERIGRWWAAVQTRNPDVEPLPSGCWVGNPLSFWERTGASSLSHEGRGSG